jgi:hypothetical protein
MTGSDGVDVDVDCNAGHFDVCAASTRLKCEVIRCLTRRHRRPPSDGQAAVPNALGP